MAMYHLRVKFMKRSEGKSSVAAAAYRACERLVDSYTGVTHDYTRKAALDHKEILLPDHMPTGMADRATLWNAVEQQLGRKDGQPAFEVEMALPRELTRAQCVQLVRNFARDQFVAEGLAVDICIHRPIASDGLEHPHVHMLITTRRWNDDGSMGYAARDLQDNPALIKRVYALEKAGRIDDALLASKGTNLARWREAWADYSNDFLERAGSDARIDHRTLAAQKIDREATPNVGVAFHRGFDGLTGWLARKVEALKDISWRNNLRQQFERIRHNRRDLTAEFIAHAREYARDLVQGIEPEPDRTIEHER